MGTRRACLPPTRSRAAGVIEIRDSISPRQVRRVSEGTNIFRPQDPPRAAIELMPPPPPPNSTVKRLFQGATTPSVSAPVQAPQPSINQSKPMRWTGSFLITNKSNSVGFSDNEVYVSLKAEMMTACLHDPNKYIVKSKNYTGPYLIKSTQEITDFFLEQGAVTLLNPTDMVDFQIVECDQSGRPTAPLTPERQQELEERLAARRAKEEPRTRRFFVMHPDDLVGTDMINSDFATLMIKNAFANFMGDVSAIDLSRLNVVGNCLTTMGFPAPQHLVYATLPEKRPPTESALWPKHLHVPELSEHLLFTVQMPKSQLNQLNLLRCCFSKANVDVNFLEPREFKTITRHVNRSLSWQLTASLDRK